MRKNLLIFFFVFLFASLSAICFSACTIGGIIAKDGKSAYELAKENGYTGTLDEWLESLKGKDGKIVYGTKKIITLGDSITALDGNRSWIKYFEEIIPTELIANTSVPGAILKDEENTVYDGNPTYADNNVLSNQVQKILNNDYEAPDFIFIAIGTNGGINNVDYEKIKNAYYDQNGNLIPLNNVDRKTTIGAFRYCSETLHKKYPDALIFWCSPIFACEKIRKSEDIIKYDERLTMLTTFSGQHIIHTVNCGISGINEKQNEEGEYLADGLHPNERGAKTMGHYIAYNVLKYCLIY